MMSSKLILYKCFSTELFPEIQRKSNEIKRKSICLTPPSHTFLRQKSQVKIVEIKKSLGSYFSQKIFLHPS